jgi:transcriptional regulator with XRE-family HTH domain
MNPETMTAHRTAAGMTQAALASFLKLSERQIIRYENGESQIPGPVQMIMNSLKTGKLPKK